MGWVCGKGWRHAHRFCTVRAVWLFFRTHRDKIPTTLSPILVANTAIGCQHIGERSETYCCSYVQRLPVGMHRRTAAVQYSNSNNSIPTDSSILILDLVGACGIARNSPSSRHSCLLSSPLPAILSSHWQDDKMLAWCVVVQLSVYL